MNLPDPVIAAIADIATGTGKSFDQTLFGIVMIGLIQISNDGHKPHCWFLDIDDLENKIHDLEEKRLSGKSSVTGYEANPIEPEKMEEA